MPDFHEMILHAVGRKGYKPLKPKALARKIGVAADQYADFRQTLRDMARKGRVTFGKDHTVRPVGGPGTVVGTFQKTSSGTGFVRPHAAVGKPGPDVRIREDDTADASTGDTVLVELLRPARGDR